MQDEVYVQVLDLDKEYRVCTADIYHHKLCLASYLKKFDCLETIEDRTRTGSQKRMFFFRGDRFHTSTSGSWLCFTLVENSRFNQ